MYIVTAEALKERGVSISSESLDPFQVDFSDLTKIADLSDPLHVRGWKNVITHLVQMLQREDSEIDIHVAITGLMRMAFFLQTRLEDATARQLHAMIDIHVETFHLTPPLPTLTIPPFDITLHDVKIMTLEVRKGVLYLKGPEYDLPLGTPSGEYDVWNLIERMTGDIQRTIRQQKDALA